MFKTIKFCKYCFWHQNSYPNCKNYILQSVKILLKKTNVFSKLIISKISEYVQSTLGSYPNNRLRWWDDIHQAEDFERLLKSIEFEGTHSVFPHSLEAW